MKIFVSALLSSAMILTAPVVCVADDVSNSANISHKSAPKAHPFAHQVLMADFDIVMAMGNVYKNILHTWINNPRFESAEGKNACKNALKAISDKENALKTRINDLSSAQDQKALDEVYPELTNLIAFYKSETFSASKNIPLLKKVLKDRLKKFKDVEKDSGLAVSVILGKALRDKTTQDVKDGYILPNGGSKPKFMRELQHGYKTAALAFLKPEKYYNKWVEISDAKKDITEVCAPRNKEAMDFVTEDMDLTAPVETLPFVEGMDEAEQDTSMGDKITQAMSTVKETASDAMQDAKNAMGMAPTEGESASSDANMSGAQNVPEEKNQTAKTIGETVSHAMTATGEAISNAAESVGEAVTSAAHSLEDTGKEMAGTDAMHNAPQTSNQTPPAQS